MHPSSAVKTDEINTSAALPAPSKSVKPVFKILDDSIKRFGNKPALSFEGLDFTYAELGKLVDKIAAGLQGIGVQKGSKVGIYMPNTHYSILFYYGVLKAGGTVVNYNPLYAMREIKFQAENSQTEFMVTLNVADLIDKTDTLVGETPVKKVVVCPIPSSDLEVISDSTHVLYEDLISGDKQLVDVAIDPL